MNIFQKTFRVILQGVFVLLLLLAMILALAPHFWFTCLVLVAIAFLILPNSTEFLHKKYGVAFRPRQLVAGFIVLFVLLIISIDFWPKPPTIVNTTPSADMIAEQEAAQKTAEAERLAGQKAIVAEFKASREHIISMLRDLIDRKGYIAAVAWGERFSDVQDAEFQKLYTKAKRLNGVQQTEMNEKMDKKQERLKDLQDINVATEGTHAISYCQSLVKAELKSPSEAKFPWDTDVKVTGTNERFIVHSYVDAPNSFNAVTRTPYFCRLSYNGGGSSGWNIEEFRVGE